MNRAQLADLILERIEDTASTIKATYHNSQNKIGYFIIDDLLPIELAKKIYAAFPNKESMTLKKSMREFKYIAAQMDQYDSLLEEITYAFQDKRIVDKIGEICSIESLYPDDRLYAGGISLMGMNQFLNPHLDNSHEVSRNRWRVLNLLYYVTPEWEESYGGNLEIWPDGLKQSQITITSAFNRLVVMATHGSSWHSVSPVKIDKNRCCVSNYYFSNAALKHDDNFHVTSFRGRPEQKLTDWLLVIDAKLRQGVRWIFPKGAVKTKHIYKK